MSVTTARSPRLFAGVPSASWAFGIRVWLAVVMALYAGFWLELESPASAAITVGILAVRTRGQALEKAAFRFSGTIIGVIASIVLVGSLSQARDLLFFAFSAWIGFSIYVAALSDGFRAYGAVLSGYTVALVAIQQIDTPNNVFNFGMQRGAAIALGIAAIAIVNDLLIAPDKYLELATQLASLHGRVRDQANAVILTEATDPVATAGLLREIAALRSEISSLQTESSDGPARNAAARGTAVALVAEIHAVRVLEALPIDVDSTIRDRRTSLFEEEAGDGCARTDNMSSTLKWAFGELRRRDQDVREGLAALRSGTWPARTWRTPFYACQRLAAETGVRASLWIALASIGFILAGWPAAEVCLVQLTAFVGLGVLTPNPRAFSVVALIGSPIGAVLAGVLDFVILDGVTDFPQLALALAPFMIGAAVLTSLPNPLLAGLGRLNLIVILVVAGLGNPQTYNAQVFLETALLSCLCPVVLLAAQLLIPPVSDERRRLLLMASVRRDNEPVSSRWAQCYTPEEAMFRDAVRIGQIAGVAGPQQRGLLEEALTLFDQAAIIQLCGTSLRDFAGSPLESLAAQAREALISRDARSIRRAASDMQEAAPEDPRAQATSAALQVTCLVMEGRRQ
ncbi:FUSC family protein [Reyranella soli]|uniref:Membrane protein n=1 Tax=Reyranella soli TaxID=1230389 RepID=A0A512NLA4_9HYPH|nr:FUSC family protein [Reyranella soli]GEP59727.1 membrane protein [Reyranella soli]